VSANIEQTTGGITVLKIFKSDACATSMIHGGSVEGVQPDEKKLKGAISEGRVLVGRTIHTYRKRRVGPMQERKINTQKKKGDDETE